MQAGVNGKHHPDAAHEEARLANLYSYALLDSAPEEEFDRIVRLVQTLFNVPMALVTLIDRDRQWFKAKVGLDGEGTTRDTSFCTHAIRRNEPMIVPDAWADERFRENPHVTGAPHVRFYAGVPLQTPAGYNLGTLCALDRQPRAFTREQIAALQDLAAMVGVLLETRRVAVTDPLTGALTRRGLDAQYEKEQARARRYGHKLTVVEFDLDRFKSVNDTYGHAAGDQVLRLTARLARLARERLRGIDTLARMGGEEFVLLLPEADLQQGLATAERLRSVLADAELLHDGKRIPITASFGVAEMDAGEDLEALVARADAALYAAKSAGRNRVVAAES